MKIINKDFSLLLGGQAVSQIGDKFHMIAISLWVLESTGSTAKMGTVLAVSWIPAVVLSLFSGAFIDRYDRKRIIVGTDFLRGAIIGLFALLFCFDYMNFYLILIMQGVLSANAAFFDPAIPAVVPQIVKKEDLTRANSIQQFVRGISTIAGASLGGICASAFGYLAVFAFNAASFIFSGCMELFITIPGHDDNESGPKSSESIFDNMRDGFSYIFKDNLIISLVIVVMLIHFCYGAIEVFMPVIASFSLDGENGRNLGFLLASLACGTVATTLVLAAKDIQGNEKRMLFSAVFLEGALLIGSSYIQWKSVWALYVFAGVLFLFGCTTMLAFISYRTLLQKRVDNRFSGRVFALAGSLANASLPAAILLYGVLLERFGLDTLLLVSGIIVLPISLVALILYSDPHPAGNEYV